MTSLQSAFEVYERGQKKMEEDKVPHPRKRKQKFIAEDEEEDTSVSRTTKSSDTSKRAKKKMKSNKWRQQRDAQMKEITPNLDIPFKEQFDLDQYDDSRLAARSLFSLLIHPYTVTKFQKNVWEQKPILIPRESPLYNDGWFSSKELDTILRQNRIEHSVNINITSYVEGEKMVEELPGRAYASNVWDRFDNGYSIQFLNPQTFSDSIWLLTSTLQEHFSSFVGANIYLTPAGTQGFAPHYDDIEAFILQVEGQKKWKLYKPRNRHEILPRFSSKDLTEDEIGQPILDVVLHPGDLLYFPRGVIHQAEALPDHHSLHITLSTCQRNTWGDLLEKMLPIALKYTINKDQDLRQSLPWDYMDYVDGVHKQSSNPQSAAFFDKLHDLTSRVIMQFTPMYSAVNEMAVDFLHTSLPPCLTEKEKDESVCNRGTHLNEDGGVVCHEVITLDTHIKLTRGRAVRLVSNDEEEEDCKLYYTCSNSRVYREKDIQGIILVEDDEAAVKHLIKSYPKYVTVRDLPMDTEDMKIELCTTLYEQGIILCSEDLPN